MKKGRRGRRSERIKRKRKIRFCMIAGLAAVLAGSSITMLNGKAMGKHHIIETQKVFLLNDVKKMHFFPEFPKRKVEEVTEEVVEEISEEEAHERKVIAFTFDDGPNPSVTRAILDILKKYNSKATFFALGERADLYGNVIKEAYEQGHQIANHTMSHKNLTKLSKESLKNEISRSEEALSAQAPQSEFYIRPPYGAVNSDVKSSISVPIVCWSVDSLDWKLRDSQRIYDEIMANVKEGDIILMHDLYTTTAEALELVIPELISQGFELVTVSELFRVKGIETEAGRVYYNAR